MCGLSNIAEHPNRKNARRLIAVEMILCSHEDIMNLDTGESDGVRS